MSIHDKDFESITEADLLQLIENKVPEGQRIEYKSNRLKPDQYSEQISSFANSSGGDLFIGITENNGFPIEINGVPLDNPDQEILNITTLMSDALDPSFKQGLVRCIPISDDRYVIAIRIPKSWDGPYRIKQTRKFMMRTNANKIELNTAEIKKLILRNNKNDITDDYDKFREERIHISKNTYGIDPPFVMIHYVPLSAFSSEDPFPVVAKMLKLDHSILGSTTAIPYPNAEGTIARDLKAHNRYREHGHTQFFKNGIIEQVSSYQFRYNEILPIVKDELIKNEFIIFHTIAFEERLKIAIERQWENYKELHMKEPFYIFFQLVEAQGVIGYPTGPALVTNGPTEIDTPLLKVPKLLIDECTEANKIEVVDKIMNFLWNTFGFIEPQPYPSRNSMTDYYYE